MMKVGVGFLAMISGAVFFHGCGAQQQDPTANLTGTESEPLVSRVVDGGVTLSCPEKKELICHVPPGNPANAHSLCVGKSAVNAHLSHHPDSIGACGDADGGIDEGDDEGDDDEIDAGPACVSWSGACTVDADCCTARCLDGSCGPRVN